MAADLVVTPNPAPAASIVVNMAGTGVIANRQSRLVLDGTPITGVFKPHTGSFSFARPIGPGSPQTLEFQQCVNQHWTTIETETITVVPGVVDPGPTPDPAPSGTEPEYADRPGWRLVFSDDFDGTIAESHFVDGATEAVSPAHGLVTADGRWLVFPKGDGTTWKDTSGHGRYDPSIISVHDGYLDIHVQTKTDAIGTWPRVATLTALPTGSSVKGGLLGMRRHIRARGDLMLHYKGVPLLWADLATSNALLMTYGEIDHPEASTNRPIHAFMHKAPGTSLSDQYVAIPSPDTVSWQTWHDYVIEWIAGTSVKFFIDGVQIGVTQTLNVPNVAMHANLQFETATSGEPAPDPSVSGHFQVDRIGIWVPA